MNNTKKLNVVYNKNIIRGISLILLILCLYEIIYGILQLIGITDKANVSDIVGSFNNSGPYACYIATILPLLLRISLTTKYKSFGYILTYIIIVAVIIILVSLSRTALLATVIGGFVAI